MSVARSSGGPSAPGCPYKVSWTIEKEVMVKHFVNQAADLVD